MAKDAGKVESVEVKRKRLKYRAWHRGTREMDLLLGHFADIYVPGFDEVELSAFEALLAESDPDLYAWYVKQSVPPEDKNTHIMKLFLGSNSLLT